jgi:hypothetical protein
MADKIMTPRSLGIARLATGLTQGLFLYLLYLAVEFQTWPATHGVVFAPLLLVAWFLPVILLLSLGDMRLRRLLAWITGVAIVLVGLGVHDITRGAERETQMISWLMGGRNSLHIWPSEILVPFTIVGLFIAQSLVAAGAGERRILATYPPYFDAAWKLAVQLALSVVFVGLFWLLLWLGAGLFELIDITFFETLIRHRWFATTATTLALACALHVTDVRGGLVRGLRVLIHVLLSWLLPLLTLVVAGFLASLPFTGLAPLWKTRSATALLLVTAAALLALINATYQDGDPTHRPARPLRYTGTLAALILLPLVAIAAYALGLRVAQHGWSTDRVIAAAILVIGGCYALGYAIAAVWPGPWLKRTETVNVASGFVILGVLLALFSPLADPTRLAVASQVARLAAGRIDPDRFDYAYLRFDGARYGKAALDELKAMDGPNAAVIRPRVEAAQHMQNRGDFTAPTAEEMAAAITVHPQDRVLPESFLKQNWGVWGEEHWMIPQCMQNRFDRCDAFLVDLDGGGEEEIVMMAPAQPWRAVAFHHDDLGRWRVIGTFSLSCERVRQAFLAGEVKAVAPQWRDLDLGGIRLHLSPGNGEQCP